MISILRILGFLTLAAVAVAQPARLEILETIDGGDDAMLYRPSAVCFGPDGSTYVLNGGDCRVLQFAVDWDLLRAFGREGEGPGEFSNPTGMIVRDQELWVFEMMRATVFSLDGEYLRTLTGRHEMHEPVLTDRGVLVRLGSSDRMAALLDDDLELAEKFGPPCPDDGDFMKKYKACGFVRALPHPDFLALLLNPFDGHLWALDDAGEVVVDRSLMDEGGDSVMDHDEDEGTMTMSFSLVMGTGGVDRHGRFWTVPLPPGEEEDADPEAQVLVVRDRALEPVAEFSLPEEVNAFRIYHAPDGRLLLLDPNASLLHVCVYPDIG